MQKFMFMKIVKLGGKHRTVKAAGTVMAPGKRKEPALEREAGGMKVSDYSDVSG